MSNGVNPRERRTAAGSRWSVRIGTLLGVPVRIHATFLLLLVWFGVVSAQQGQGFLSGIVFLLLLFGCVVLHELGHATMARRYGVHTSEIVLYPIGGIAKLDRIPGGKAELLIALAGPAVNLVLAVLLGVGMVLLGLNVPHEPGELLSGVPFLWQLLSANIMLFLFNLIPAFPMDGGRVLRASLSIRMGQARATAIAAKVGQGFAILFGLFALLKSQPFLLLIAFFVFLSAGQEAAYQRGRAAVRGLTARSAMITRFEKLAPQDSLGRAAELLLATHQQDFPVVDLWGRVAGVLSRSRMLAGLAAGGREVAVLEAMDREVSEVRPDTPLEEVLNRLQSSPLQPILVVGEAGLEGMITLENFGELLEVSRSLHHTGAPAT